MAGKRLENKGTDWRLRGKKKNLKRSVVKRRMAKMKTGKQETKIKINKRKVSETGSMMVVQLKMREKKYS